MAKFDITRFLMKLQEGKITEEAFTQTVEIFGLIKPNEFNNGLLFAPNRCDAWFSLRSDIIRGMRFVKLVHCSDRQYPFYSILIEPYNSGIITMQETIKEEAKMHQEKYRGDWVAVCTCGWRGSETFDMMQAVREGRDHESFYNGFPPIGQRHFTHPELVFNEY